MTADDVLKEFGLTLADGATHWERAMASRIAADAAELARVRGELAALTPSDGTSSTGAAGTPTPASARVPAGHTGSDAAPPVVVLDEWRVVYGDGSMTFAYFSENQAAKRAAKDNETFEGCGARVMRVCLQEVPDA